jgi:hypothetical protein
MKHRRLIQFAVTVLLGEPCWGGNGCPDPLMQPLGEVQRVIESLQPDPSRADRMIAGDGRVYSVDQSAWMHEELRLIAEACSRGRQVEGTWRLESLQRAVQEGRPASNTRCKSRARESRKCAGSGYPLTAVQQRNPRQKGVGP